MDYAKGRYFRASLFVHAEAPFSRVAADDALTAMWATTDARETSDGLFQTGQRSVRVSDPRRAALLRALIDRRPDWVAVNSLAADAGLLASLRHYALEDVVKLATTAPRFAIGIPRMPQASPLARMQIAQRSPTVATLAHQLIGLQDADLRHLIPLLDGTRDRAALEEAWVGWEREMPLDTALKRVAAGALLIRSPAASDS
jgi:hypothetical protein